MYFPITPLDGLSTGLSVSDCFQPSSRSPPARDLTSHPCIPQYEQTSFFHSHSSSFSLSSLTRKGGAGADRTEFQCLQLKLHYICTLSLPHKGELLVSPSTDTPDLCLLPYTSKAYPPSFTEWGKQPDQRLPLSLSFPVCFVLTNREHTHTPIRTP